MKTQASSTTFKEPNKVFDEAIEKGLLSTDEKKENFAGNYMYMYSQDNKDFFKNHITREYIK
jgi:hypothetical protein